MKYDRAKQKIQDLLEAADLHINGGHPWDPQVNNPEFYPSVLLNGSLGVGMAYVEKWWDCLSLDEFYARLLRTSPQNELHKNWMLLSQILLSKLINRQTVLNAFSYAQKHYDLGNDLFIGMLDKRLVYTCAYWKEATTLDQAQENKLDLTCRKLNLQPGMKVLDVGCGWGSFARYAAENYGVSVTGITVAEEQVKLANELCRNLPVEIKLMDYRQVHEKFDRIVSLGMFEHVGYKNYRKFMTTMNGCLKDDGLFLLHTIGSNITSTWTDPWIDKFIFPGTLLPSIKQIGQAIEGLFVMEDWHNFSADYDKTLMAWHQNFIFHWSELKDKYDEAFFRMWNYYLLSCAGSFRARKNQLWQIVLSKEGIAGGYHRVQ